MLHVIILLIAMAISAYVFFSSAFSGGERFSDGRISSDASRFRHESATLKSAIDLYKTTGGNVKSDTILTDLKDQRILKSIPKDWESHGEFLIKNIPENEHNRLVCERANSDAGFQFKTTDTEVFVFQSSMGEKAIPLCSKENLNKLTPCCINPPVEEGST